MKTLTFNKETRGICYSPKLEKGAIATPIGVKPFSLKEDSIRNIFKNDEYYFNASVTINDSLDVLSHCIHSIVYIEAMFIM
jgi:hypothetical protein